MKKSIYLFILFLIATHFQDFLPITSVIGPSKGFISLFLAFIWVILGFKFYNRNTIHDLYNRHNFIPFIWIMIGIILSMVPAYLFYQQPITQSLISYRLNYTWVVIPLLLYIKPSEKDIINSLNWFAVFYILMAFMRTYIAPQMFSKFDADMMDNSINDNDQLLLGSGISLLLFPVYYYSSLLRYKVTKRCMILVALYVLLFYIMQNRSTLFVVVLIVVYAAFTNKSKGRILLILLTVFLSIVFIYNTLDKWTELYNETITQINDQDYNRVKAFTYFLFEANTNWITYIIGNGFLSAHITSHMQVLMEMGIYNSDLGFIGYWNQFGIIPIIVFLLYIIKAFQSKKCPFYVKAIGFHILICSFTLSYFGSLPSILWFAIFYYLYVYFESVNHSMKL